MSLKDTPTNDRPREKLLRYGADALSTEELLAIILRVGVQGQSVVEMSRALLARFGGLSGLLMASVDDLQEIKGLGAAKAAQLAAVMGLARKHYQEALSRGDLLNNPEAAAALLKTRLAHESREVFAVLFLDNQHRYLALETLFAGTINAAHVHPREIAKHALQLNAAGVILAHNHPSGSTNPSQSDIDITHTISNALALIEVNVIDHFIIGDGIPVSLRERGLM